MWKNIAVAGAVTAAIVGAGGAALAASGSDSPSPSPAASASADTNNGSAPKLAKNRAQNKKLGAELHKSAHLERAVHAQWVSRGKDNTFITHDAIRGQVSAVSATSISVKAADGLTQTYSVSSDTAVRVRTDGKGAKGQISQVKTGDAVLVTGTGTTSLKAEHILDIGAK